jgi:integrin beta 3
LPGLDGAHGKDGRDGLPGLPGRDGKDGAPGARGEDGFGFDEFEAEYDGERAFKFIFIRGERRKEFAFNFPVPIERGVYEGGRLYQRGDIVSFGGSFWIAQRDTKAYPETNKDWRLAVKRGRDGKDGKDGRAGERGAPGKDAR